MHSKRYLNECRDQTILNNVDPFRIAISFDDIEMGSSYLLLCTKKIGKIDSQSLSYCLLLIFSR